ncbi:MAG: N-acetylmuramoyl-L-alanine amidase [Oscillospiraceae bacterium]|nr:N-acetylmuramoyl-L-alanine amidase [Oscillospiraceae bacterium]
MIRLIDLSRGLGHHGRGNRDTTTAVVYHHAYGPATSARAHMRNSNTGYQLIIPMPTAPDNGLPGDVWQMVSNLDGIANHTAVGQNIPGTNTLRYDQTILNQFRPRSVNRHTIGIAFGGNWSNAIPPQQMIDTAHALNRWLITPTNQGGAGFVNIQRFYGHRDFNGWVCPGLVPFEDFNSILEDDMPRIMTIQDVPGWAQSQVRRWIADGIVTGRGMTPLDEEGLPTDLDITEDMIRSLFFQQRMIQKAN